MDYSSACALVLILLSFGCLSKQMVPVTENDGVSEISGNITACINSKGAAGGCVVRNRCNYNTSNIDLTVYGPPGYRNPCLGTEACCPTKYILPATPAKSTDDDEFDFDDDVD